MSSSELGKWTDRLFDDIFYQPDDELSLKTMQDNISPVLQLRFNGNLLSFDDWKNVIIGVRAKNTLTIKTNRELLSSDSSVAHISTFILKDKETGVEKADTSVTISTVAWKDGKRILTELSELYSSSA